MKDSEYSWSDSSLSHTAINERKYR